MAEFIRHFGIDWKLFLAQAVNFFILLFVLKKFAYGPILELFRKRRTEIQEGIAMRREAEKHLREVDSEKQKILSNAEREAISLIDHARETAKKQHQEIVAEAGAKAESIRAQTKHAILQERAAMTAALYDDAKELVRLGVQRVLQKIPAKNRDQMLIKEALRELEKTV